MALSIFSLMGSIFVDSSEAETSIAKTEEKSSKLSESFVNGISTAGKWAAGIATAAAGAALAVGGAAINVSDDVDTAMGSFAAATGTAVDGLAEYEDAMINIYNGNYGESFDDIANSMAQVKQIMGEGIGTDELEKMTTDALMLRDTFEMDVSESVRTANSLMDQFGISGDAAYNLIAQGAQNGLNQNGDMLDVLNEYSVQFAQMGFDAESMFNMLVNGAESGTWSIDKLGDAAKEFNIRMTDGSAKDAVEALGFSWEEVSGKWAAGGESANQVMQQIMGKLGEVGTTTEGYNAGVGLLGTMFEDLGVDAVTALANTQGEISTTTDAMKEMDAVKYDNLGSMFEGLKRNLETILLPLGNALIPVIMQVCQLILDNMPIIEGLIAQVTPIITQLFSELLPPLVNLISSLMPQFSSVIEMVLPPLIDLLSTIVPIITGIIEAILPVFISLIEMLLPPLMDIVNMILPILVQLINLILPLLQPIIDLLQPIIDLCMAILTPLLQLLDIILPPLITVLQFLISNVLAGLKVAFETVGNVISNVINVAVSYVTKQIDILKNIFSNVISFIKNVFTGNWRAAFENVKNILGNIFKGMLNVVKSPINAIIGVINGLVGGVTKGINSVIKTLNKLKIDVPSWVTKLTGVKNFGFNLKEVSAPKIPYLAEGGDTIEEGQAIVGEAGAELIDLPKGAKVTPLTDNGDPIGYKAVASKLDTMIALLSAILEKEGVINIGEKQFVNYINKSLGAFI